MGNGQGASRNFPFAAAVPYAEYQRQRAAFGREDLEDGEAHITRMDGTIISGTFSGGSIKEGRFDIKYREKPEGGEAVY